MGAVVIIAAAQAAAARKRAARGPAPSRVLARVRQCEDGLRAAGGSAGADEVYALGLVLANDAAARRRPNWSTAGWWLPLGSSNLFDGPGAWMYFAGRSAWKRSRRFVAAGMRFGGRSSS